MSDIEHQLAALASQVRRRLAQAISANPDGTAVLASWHTQLVQARISRHRALNDGVKLVVLPACVLCRVAQHLSLWGQIVMSHICHRVRDALLAEPSLWNNFATYHVPTEATVHFLDRSAQIPARLGTGIAATTLSVALHILPPHISRFNLLRLQLYVSYASTWTFDVDGAILDKSKELTQHDWMNLCSTLLRSPAALLTTLTLENICVFDWEVLPSDVPRPLDRSHPLYWEVPSDLLGGEPGELLSCYFRGLHLPRLLPRALCRLTTFEYRSAVRMTPACLDDILAWLPELRKLGLSYVSWDNGDGDGSHCQAVHQSLRKVAIHRVVEHHPGIMTYLQRHAVDDIFVYQSYPNTLIDEGPVNVISIQRTCVSLRFAEPRRLRITGSFTERMHRDMAFPTSFGNVTILTVAEIMWTLYAPFPSAPRLEVLRIVLSGCAELSRWQPTTEGDDSTLFSSGAGAALECPSLRLLEISASDPGSCDEQFSPACFCSGCTLSFFDVATFIRNCLQFASPRLGTRRLHGTECIDVDPSAAWNALSAVVSSVHILPSAAPDMLVSVTVSGALTSVFDKKRQNEPFVDSMPHIWEYEHMAV